jgi:transcription-repair coupling factor (superfamily II helicase)
VFTLGEAAALDPFLLAKHVQGSGGALRLTPDMKLVATLGGAKPAPSARAVARAAKGAKAARKAPAPAPPIAPASPALEAATGRELLAAAREVLTGLRKCARAS